MFAFRVDLKNCWLPRPEQGWFLPFCPGTGVCQARGGRGKARRVRSPLPPVMHPPAAARGHPRTALDMGSTEGGGPRSAEQEPGTAAGAVPGPP